MPTMTCPRCQRTFTCPTQGQVDYALEYHMASYPCAPEPVATTMTEALAPTPTPNTYLGHEGHTLRPWANTNDTVATCSCQEEHYVLGAMPVEMTDGVQPAMRWVPVSYEDARAAASKAILAQPGLLGTKRLHVFPPPPDGYTVRYENDQWIAVSDALHVMRTNAYFIGRDFYELGPETGYWFGGGVMCYSRESPYFRTSKEAEEALATGRYEPRIHP